jgi:plasmid stabilization system protein ParE
MTAQDFYLHPAAIEEAEAAARWYMERSPRAARIFVDELNLVLDRILEAPNRWPRSTNGTRKLNLPCFPFVVIYPETEDHVRILAVAHGRRRPGYWKYRLSG